MANVLPRSKQVAVVAALTEGCSLRSTARMTGVDRETVGTILGRVGLGCLAVLDETMVDLPCERLELDELWAFVGKKQRNVKDSDDASKGDTWTWLAIDADTKLVPAFRVGKRTDADARLFISDLAARLAKRVQISTDGLKAYVKPIGTAFGAGGVDYAMVIFGALGLSSTIGLAHRLWRSRHQGHLSNRWPLFIGIIICVYAAQLTSGLIHDSAVGYNDRAATFVYVLFGVGIARAWQLLGLKAGGILDQLGVTVTPPLKDTPPTDPPEK